MYLLSSTNTYRVETEESALALRDKLNNLSYGELVAFSYTIKEIKQKGEVIGNFYVVKAKIEFNKEREPESMIQVSYELGQ